MRINLNYNVDDIRFIEERGAGGSLTQEVAGRDQLSTDWLQTEHFTARFQEIS